MHILLSDFIVKQLILLRDCPLTTNEKNYL